MAYKVVRTGRDRWQLRDAKTGQRIATARHPNGARLVARKMWYTSNHRPENQA